MAMITLTEDQVDDLIDDWHRGARFEGDSERRLHEYLGWTWKQYTAYVERGEIPEQEDTELLQERLRGGS
jgi:hypothetical protein